MMLSTGISTKRDLSGYATNQESTSTSMNARGKNAMVMFSWLPSAIIGGMRRTKSEKLSDEDLLSQVKKALGKPRVAKSIRKGISSEIASSASGRNCPKVRKGK